MVKIKKITIDNLFSYHNKTEINFDEKNIIVGPNDAGKSSVFKSLKFLFDNLAFYNRDVIRPWNSLEHYASISIDLQLSDLVERLVLLDILCAKPYDQNRNTFRLEKFKQEPLLLDKIKEVTLTVIWDINDYVDSRHNFKFYLKLPSLGFTIESQGFGSGSGVFIDPQERGERELPKTIFDIVDSIDYSNTYEEIVQKKFPPKSDVKIEVASIPSPTQFSDTGTHDHVLFADTKVRLNRIFDASGIVPQQGQSYSFSLIFSNMLRRKITLISERRDFRNSEDLIHAELAEDGHNLQTFLFWLSTSDSSKEKERLDKIKELFEKVMTSQNLTFDIQVTKKEVEKKDHYDWGPKTMIPDKSKITFVNTVGVEKNRFDFNEVGAGVKECLFLITKCLTAEHSVIMMDEPALHLHPLQIKMLMKEIFSLNKDNSSLSQIIIITHSASIASLDILSDANQIIRIKKSKGSSLVIQPDKNQRAWLIDNLPTFHLLKPDVLFAKSTILVEGQSDRILLETLLKDQGDKLGIPLDVIHVLDVGGNKSFPKFQQFLEMFDVPYLILADGDVQGRFTNSTFNIVGDPTPVDEKKKIYVLKVKDLEAYLANLNQELYNEASSKYDRKPEVAYHFIKQLLEKELPDGIKPILSLVRTASKLS